MADERDLELLDDYLTNRMSGQDRHAFEQKLQADPDLQHEYAMQNRLIKGIKDARVAELKAILNNVPVPSKGPGNAVATKIIFGTVITIMVAATYWYISRDDIKQQISEPAEQEEVIEALPESARTEEEVVPEAKQESKTKQNIQEPDKNQTSAGTEQSKPSLAGKPDPLKAPEAKDNDEDAGKERVPDVFDPSAEDSSPVTDPEKDKRTGYTASGTSSLLVETDRENTRYKFHYQFKQGKLYLYGPFEKNLYEIMEFFSGDKRTVFLFYKDQYYRLEEAENDIRLLEPITDPALLKKLRASRSAQ